MTSLARRESTIRMIFPQPVTLTLDSREVLKFTKGVHEVPVSVANHWYVKSRGARPFDRKSKPDRREQLADQLAKLDAKIKEDQKRTLRQQHDEARKRVRQLRDEMKQAERNFRAQAAVVERTDFEFAKGRAALDTFEAGIAGEEFPTGAELQQWAEQRGELQAAVDSTRQVTMDERDKLELQCRKRALDLDAAYKKACYTERNLRTLRAKAEGKAEELPLPCPVVAE